MGLDTFLTYCLRDFIVIRVLVFSAISGGPLPLSKKELPTCPFDRMRTRIQRSLPDDCPFGLLKARGRPFFSESSQLPVEGAYL